MSIVMIGRVLGDDMKTLAGFRLLDTESKDVRDIPIANLTAGLKQGVKVDNLGIENGQIVGTNGAIDRYGILNQKPAMVIIKRLKKDGVTVGFVVSDEAGKIVTLKKDHVVQIANKVGIANGKLVNGDISSISGNYNEDTIEAEFKKKEQQIKEAQERAERKNSTMTKVVQEDNDNRDSGKETTADRIKKMRQQRTVYENGSGNSIEFDSSGRFGHIVDVKLPDYDGNKMVDSRGWTVEEKLSRVYHMVMAIDKFAYCVLFELNATPIEKSICDTMAVTDTGRLLYSCEFVRDTHVDGLLFIVLHEIYHVVMRHATRGSDKDHDLFNDACDLYINKLLCEQFGLTPSGGKVLLTDDHKYNNSPLDRNYLKKDPYIEFGDYGYYSAEVDTLKDTPEIIYGRLLNEKLKQQHEEQKKKEQQQQDKDKNGQNNSQQKGNEDGDGEKDQEQNQNQQGQNGNKSEEEQQKDKQKQNGGSSSDGESEDEENEDGNGENSQSKEKKEKGQGSNQDGQDDETGDGEESDGDGDGEDGDGDGEDGDSQDGEDGQSGNQGNKSKSKSNQSGDGSDGEDGDSDGEGDDGDSDGEGEQSNGQSGKSGSGKGKQGQDGDSEDGEDGDSDGEGQGSGSGQGNSQSKGSQGNQTGSDGEQQDSEGGDNSSGNSQGGSGQPRNGYSGDVQKSNQQNGATARDGQRQNAGYGELDKSNQGQQGQGQGQSQQGDGQRQQGEQGESDADGQGDGQGGAETWQDLSQSDSILRGVFKELEGVKRSDLLRDRAATEESKSVADAKIDAMMKRAEIHAKNIGAPAGSFIERMIQASMEKKVDFRAYIKKQLLELSAFDRSFKQPDKRFVARGLTLPGKTPLEPDKLKGVKICIDTSGSISDAELAEALGIVLQLMKQFKAEGEIVYWDTSVRAITEFKKVDDVLKSKPHGGGGTDVTCIFDYFENRKLCKYPATLVIVITDGLFSIANRAKIAAKYGKKTIWIINNSTYKSFEAPFGKRAPIKCKND